MKRVIIELQVVVWERGGVGPANTPVVSRSTAGEIAEAHGVPASEVVRVALALGIGALAYEPDEVARIEEVLRQDGGPDEAA